MHRKLVSPSRLWFAGGGWTWGGIAPLWSKAKAVTEASIKVMKEEGVKNLFYTFWLDNGAETPLATSFYMLTRLASLAYGQNEDNASRLLDTIFTPVSDDLGLLDLFDNIIGDDNREAANPSKWLFWQDPLVGIFDRSATAFDWKGHYSALVAKLEKACGKESFFQPVFRYYRGLARILSQKATTGLETRVAYREGDRKTLASLSKRMKELSCLVREAGRLRKEIWLAEDKVFGLEVLEIRFFGLAGRLESAAERIQSWLDGKTDRLEELETELLAWDDSRPIFQLNLWERIASACNLVGV